MRVEAHRAGRQDDSAKPLRPAGGVALDAEVERRLRAVRRRDGAGDALAIGRAPALGEPGGRIVVERIGTRPECRHDRARLRAAPHWRARRMGRWPAQRARLDREVDRRMVGRVEKQDLRRGDDQRPFQRAAALGHAFFQPPRQRLADRAEPAKRDGGDRARQRPVARVEAAPMQRKVGGEPLIERTRQSQGFGDGARRGDPRRHARRRRGRRFRTARMKSARLSRQTSLASNQNCRPLSAGLYAKSKADLRPTSMNGSRRAAAQATKGEARHMNDDLRRSPPARRPAKSAARELPPAARRALGRSGGEARRGQAEPAARDQRPRRPRPGPLWRLGGEGLASDF